MGITFDIMDSKIEDFEINMLLLGKFLSIGLVNLTIDFVTNCFC